MMKDFVALDLETTGLDFDHDEIIEVALVRFRDSLPAEEFDALVKPAGTVRPFIQSLTGIAPSDLETAVSFAELAPRILEFIGTDTVVAHNVSFDAKFLRDHLAKAGHAAPISFLDTLTAARVAWSTAPNHRLATLVQLLNIDRSRGHRALPDALACGELFVRAQEVILGMSDFERNTLARIAAGTPWQAVFGDFSPSIRHTVEPKDCLNSNQKAPPRSGALTEGSCESCFEENGPLATALPKYTPRPMQMEMARVAAHSMEKGGVAFVEAGTAVGKTLAYLVPALRRAALGDRVLISTATRALQDQIWSNDLPALLPLAGGGIEAALVKGRSNYLCLRKFQDHLDNPSLLTPEEREQFFALIPWAEQTTTGDAGENNGFNHRRNHQLWGKLASEAATCVGPSCPFHSRCFGLGARRRAERARILVVNHALFLQDLALDFALLPPSEYAVFDEAHRLPDASGSAFGRHIWFFRLRNLLKVLAHTKNPKQGLLRESALLLGNEGHPDVEAVRGLVLATEKSLHKFFLRIGKAGRRNRSDSGDGRVPFAGTLAVEFDADPAPVLEALQHLRSALSGLAALLRSQATSQAQGTARDLEGSASALSGFSDDLSFIARGSRDGWVAWVEDANNPHTLHLRAQPLEPGSFWSDKYFPWVKSALFTSATLATGGSMDYIRDRMGAPLRTYTRVLDSTGPQDERRRVVVADFLPKPGEDGFQAQLDNLLAQLLSASTRNSLVLYTSNQSLERSHTALSPVFASTGKQLLSQHSDGQIEGLLDMLRTSEGACLLGAQSLWEGVDLPGKALEIVVVTRLPFPSPGDPIVSARADAIKARGGNAFQELFVPEAILGLRQGIGRLLRSPDDTGWVVILDKRVVTEAYGKKFRRLWGEQQTVAHSVEELQGALQ